MKKAKQAKNGPYADAGSKFLRRAARRLAERIHGGEHRETGRCPCGLWNEPGFRKPGAMKGHA